MSGHLGYLSQSQQQALERLREAFKDDLLPQHDDHLLLQFLRAKKFDRKKAEDMFRRHLEFRKEFPEEYYAKDYQLPKNISILVDLLLPSVIGYDKDGCPIRIATSRQQDITGLLSCFRPSEIKKYMVWFMDTDKVEMRKRSKEMGLQIEKKTIIIDLDGLNLMQIYRRDVYEIALTSLKLYENNYPDNLKIVFIINTPAFFHYLFNMIKPFLSENTCEILKIYGTSGWKEALLEHIDADLLPVIYGGTRIDPDGDPNCPSIVKILSCVPKELYLKNINTLTEDEENVHKVLVGPRSKSDIHLKVDVSGSTVGWQVQCVSYNIKTYLVYSESPKHEIVVKPLLVYSHLGSETGSYIAERTGNYSLVFDNSYSTFRSKQVLYKAYVNASTSENYHEIKSALAQYNSS